MRAAGIGIWPSRIVFICFFSSVLTAEGIETSISVGGSVLTEEGIRIRFYCRPRARLNLRLCFGHHG